MLIITVIYSLISIIALLHYKRNTILLFPLLNIIADISINSLGVEKASFHPGHVRAIVIIIYFIIYFRELNLDNISRMIISFLFYMFIIIIVFSSDILFSMNIYSRVFIYYMMYPFAYCFINSWDKFTRFNKMILYSYLLIVLNLIISNVFGLGESQYVSNTFYEGTGGDPISYSILFFIISPMILLVYPWRKKWKFLIKSENYFSLFFVLLSVRRAAIIATALGLLIQVFLIRSKKYIYGVSFGIIILLVFYPYYEQALLARVQGRERIIYQTGLEGEARYLEVIIVVDEFLHKSVIHSLFGSELFNSYNYSSEKLSAWGLSQRNFHTFFATFLHGSGLIGLIMSILIFYKIFMKIISFSKVFSTITKWKYIKFTSLTLIIVWFIQLNSFGIWLLTENSLFYMFLGGVLGTSSTLIKKQKNNYLVI